jgi:ABC-type enterochelin transport system substrate-binding protein
MDKDTIDLTDVQKSANGWREIIEIFDREQEQREFETIKNLNRLIKSIETLQNTFQQNHLYVLLNKISSFTYSIRL